MNITREGLTIGFLIVIVLGGGISIYTLNSKIITLESQIQEFKDQKFYLKDLTEFQQEVLYYQSHGFGLNHVYWPINSTCRIGLYIEMLLFGPELYPELFSASFPNTTVSVHQVSKLELREEVQESLYKTGRQAGEIFVNPSTETFYVRMWGTWEVDHKHIRVLWWSPSAEG